MSNDKSIGIPGLLIAGVFLFTASPVWAKESEDPIRLNNRGIASMNAGKFKDAIRLLQMAHEARPDDSTILQNLAMAMNNLGVQYLSETEPDKAMRWLTQSMQLYADETIRKNLAQAYIQKGRRESSEGRLELARQMFRDATSTDPQSSVAHEWLGRNLYEQGLLHEALKAIEQAYQLEKREDLKILAEKIQREKDGEKNFFEQRRLHFRISYSPDIRSDHLSRAGWALERAYQENRTFLGETPQGDIPVVFYSSKERFTGTHELTSNVAGIYDGKVRAPLPDNPHWESFERTLSHEVAHAFLFELGGPDIPLWLNEGLAELLSAGQDRPTPSLNRAVESGESLIPLNQLTETLKNLKNNTAATLAYDESYAIAKYIHGRFGIFGIRRLLQTFRAGRSEEEALREALFMTPQMIQQSWEARIGR